MGARKVVVNFSIFGVDCFIPENNLSCTFRTDKYIRPNRVTDLSNSTVRVFRFVHPAAFIFYLLENALGLFLECNNIDRRVVVVGNKSRSRRKVVQNCFANAQPRERSPNPFSIFIRLFLQNGTIRLHLIAKRHNYFTIATHLRGHACHTGSAETVEHDIPRLRVRENVPHDGLMRHLGVV